MGGTKDTLTIYIFTPGPWETGGLPLYFGYAVHLYRGHTLEILREVAAMERDTGD